MFMKKLFETHHSEGVGDSSGMDNKLLFLGANKLGLQPVILLPWS